MILIRSLSRQNFSTLNTIAIYGSVTITPDTLAWGISTENPTQLCAEMVVIKPLER